MAREGTSVDKAQTAPHEDDSRKPDSPGELTKPSWKYTAKKAFAEFGRDQCTDLAAALTYYAVLAIFPALLALVSLLGVFGQGESTTRRCSTSCARSARGRRRRAPGSDRADDADPGRRLRVHLRNPRCHLVGVRVRGRLRPGHEPDLPDRRGAPGLEAAPAAARPHPCRHHPAGPGAHRPRRERAAGQVHRRRHRPRRHLRDGVGHRQVARHARASSSSWWRCSTTRRPTSSSRSSGG